MNNKTIIEFGFRTMQRMHANCADLGGCERAPRPVEIFRFGIVIIR